MSEASTAELTWACSRRGPAGEFRRGQIDYETDGVSLGGIADRLGVVERPRVSNSCYRSGSCWDREEGRVRRGTCTYDPRCAPHLDRNGVRSQRVFVRWLIAKTPLSIIIGSAPRNERGRVVYNYVERAQDLSTNKGERTNKILLQMDRRRKMHVNEREMRRCYSVWQRWKIYPERAKKARRNGP